MLPPEVQGPVIDSIDTYANGMAGLSIRQILNTDWKPPTITLDNGLDLSDPETRHYVRFWADSMTQWRQKYGSIEGYSDFHDYWLNSGTGLLQGIGNVSAADAFNNPQFQTVRDFYGHGGSGSYEIYGR